MQFGLHMIPKAMWTQRNPWLHTIEQISVSSLCFIYLNTLTRSFFLGMAECQSCTLPMETENGGEKDTTSCTIGQQVTPSSPASPIHISLVAKNLESLCSKSSQIPSSQLLPMPSPHVTPLGLSCWHVSLMYLYSALYDSCELLMCTTGSLDAHTGHFHYLDT